MPERVAALAPPRCANSAPPAWQVHAVARSTEALEALAGETGCIPHALDVTDNTAVEAAFGNLAVDVLVNNAAVLKRILEVNVEGVAAMLRAVIPGMRARNRGHIVNITSIAALHPLPGQIAYSASKMALRAMTQNLRIELYGKRIRVTEIAPARVETYFHAQQFFGDQARPL